MLTSVYASHALIAINISSFKPVTEITSNLFLGICVTVMSAYSKAPEICLGEDLPSVLIRIWLTLASKFVITNQIRARGVAQ